MKTIDILVNLLYPPKCAACGELLPTTWESPLCQTCRKEWDGLTQTSCPQCKRVQSDCRCLPPLLTDLRAEGLHFVPYQAESVTGRLLLVAKDERLPLLVDFFAEALEDAIRCRGWLNGSDRPLITYLPRGYSRAAVSGVDQSRALAMALGKRLDLSVVKIFTRRSAASQKELTSKERLRMARRTYRLRKNLPDLTGRTVLLVDDIMTTGATMIAGAELLRSAGAKAVYCVTVGKTFQVEK